MARVVMMTLMTSGGVMDQEQLADHEVADDR